MKKLLSIILSIIICAVSVQGVFAESSDVDINTERNVYDDCADFSKVVAYSEGLSLDVVTDENKYAFSGDDTHIIRVTSDAEWLEYAVEPNGYFVFNTAFSPNEELSHFTFESSADGENWTSFNPIITVDDTEPSKWITVHYSLKKLPAEAKFIKIIFGNIGGTPWSPCIESIELKEHNTDEVGFADCVSTKYYNSTAKLKNLGLINGYSNSEFKPSGDITRAEFSAMMAKLLDLNSVYNPASLKQVFNDVTADYWGAGSIYALYSLGIVNGDENGNFNPELNISLQEAVKIMVSSLGYTAVANQNGGYPSGYMREASRLKLFKEIEDLKNEDSLSRGDAAILMDNALDVELIYQTSFGDGQNRYEYDGSTILNRYHGIYERRGEITDVGYASVFAEGAAKDGRFELNNQSYKTGDYDMLQYLGIMVTAYVKYDKDENDYTALYVEQDKNTKITEIDYNSYDRLDDGYLCYNGDDGREKRIAVGTNTKVIYNYKYQTRVGLIDNIDIKCGYLKVISNNVGSSYADYIMVYDYDTYIASDSSKLGGVLTDKYKGAVNFNLDEADTVILKYDNEKVLYTPEYKINKNEVVCIAKSEDGKIADIRISVDTDTGTVTNINSSEQEYTIGDKTYKLSNYFLDTNRTIDISSDTVTVYLDINGNIVDCRGAVSGERYGYLKSVSELNDVFGNTATLQIITESGKAEEIKATSKSSLNGSVSSVKSFFNLSPQLVKFSLKGDGTIAVLDTAVDLFGEVNTELFTRNYVSDSAKFYDTLNIFASKYQLSSETQVFVVPNDKSEIAKYEVSDLSRLLSDTAYNVQLFDLNDEYKVGAAVITLGTDDADIYNYSPVGVIINSGTYVNDEGDKCLSLKMFSGGEEKELLFDNDGATDRTNGWIDGYVNRDTKNGVNPFSTGEVLQYSERDGKCAAFRILLTKEQIYNNDYYEKNLADYGALSEELFYSELYTSLGIVDKKFSDKILLMGNTIQGYLRTIPLNGSVYVYDRRTKVLIKGDNSDIEQGGSVFVQMRYGIANTVLVIRN